MKRRAALVTSRSTTEQTLYFIIRRLASVLICGDSSALPPFELQTAAFCPAMHAKFCSEIVAGRSSFSKQHSCAKVHVSFLEHMDLVMRLSRTLEYRTLESEHFT